MPCIVLAWRTSLPIIPAWITAGFCSPRWPGSSVSGMADKVLKPLLLGPGVDAPVPVLGGMATGGILDMFVGVTLLALGYPVFMNWVATKPDST